MIALFGLGGYFWSSHGAQDHPVLIARTTLQPGHVITQADLGASQISGGDGVASIPGESWHQQLGQLVQSTIPAGSIINPAQLGADLRPDSNRSIVGIPVKAGAMPTEGVRPGDPVTVIVNSGAVNNPNVHPGTSWPATVAAVGPTSDNQSSTVDVLVDKNLAPDVGNAAGSGSLSVILNSGK